MPEMQAWRAAAGRCALWYYWRIAWAKNEPLCAACAGCVAHGAAADVLAARLERAGCWQPISFPRYSVLLTGSD